MSEAIGLVEVIGYVAAIEAADAALKAANINLLGVEKVSGGIVTVKLKGDVGAVKASVEAGGVSASKVGTLRSVHVIPRISEEVYNVIQKEKKEEPKIVREYESIEKKIPEIMIEDVKVGVLEDKVIDAIDKSCENIKEFERQKEGIELVKDEFTKEEIESFEEKDIKNQRIILLDNKSLGKMSVSELRKYAMSLQLSIDSKEIKSMKKEDLIKVLLNFNEEGGN